MVEDAAAIVFGEAIKKAVGDKEGSDSHFLPMGGVYFVRR